MSNPYHRKAKALAASFVLVSAGASSGIASANQTPDNIECCGIPDPAALSSGTIPNPFRVSSVPNTTIAVNPRPPWDGR